MARRKKKKAIATTVTQKERPKIIQLVTSQWGGDKSSLYGLLSDGQVLQYMPSVDPSAAGWKKLPMQPAAIAVNRIYQRNDEDWW